ncbi:sensor histidine kinase [Ancylomarina euxinus]|uniref:histidine kinase n=1 Tax=Ancylomarina euxinus TaxID=2283627 RepID=A0A425Y814_9BACT|nr:HAMP domain-containing sensor histidine kinase [Ancylomarina euxinus]MCZ4693495.1 HAMP domain-containing sensor histidine kinase [Ancylomarina euxinus]MUP13722.1 ATP-binding protein [Ancylomarina euxinus]RRG24640.1 sensor histidine kinase [Ancylomarina euxinus]
MNIFLKKRQWKIGFLLFAGFIVLGSIFYTSSLVKELAKEEEKKVKLWAEALASIDSDLNHDSRLLLKILEQNETIPIILTNEENEIIDHRNLKFSRKDSIAELRSELEKMKSSGLSFEIELYGVKTILYYDDSSLLKQLALYPFIQLGLIAFLVLLAYLVFTISKKAEQDQVWVGMSKETAHQLGTPISSLLAWMELLKDSDIDKSLTQEMGKDVERLEVIAERFSKIGSRPVLVSNDIKQILEESINYLKKRSSNKIEFSVNIGESIDCKTRLNKELFSWVIENTTKNAIDAMSGAGRLSFDLRKLQNNLCLDICDTGKGIHKKQYRAIFEPGYTTKKRGWGLGLSLAKRIIEEYHGGKIFVHRSELGKGSCIRILLPTN